MKSLMTTTALIVATSLPVAAKEMTNTGVFMEYNEGDVAAAEMLATDLIGMRVFSSEKEIVGDRVSDIDAEWNDIGEVSDVVMSRDGETQSILLDIGGFLGIGEKTVAVNFDELRFVPTDGQSGDFFLAFTASQQMLEEAEPFNFDQIGAWTSAKWSETKATASDAMNSLGTSVSAIAEDVQTSTTDAYDDAKQATLATADEIEKSANNTVDAASETAKNVGQEVEQTAVEAGNAIERTTADLTVPSIEREDYESLDVEALTSEDLTGAPVYDAKDEWIGEVSELVLDDDGQVQKAVLDVGGFLGIGEKPVATTLDSLTIKRATDGSDLRVYVDATKEELENMPSYNES